MILTGSNGTIDLNEFEKGDLEEKGDFVKLFESEKCNRLLFDTITVVHSLSVDERVPEGKWYQGCHFKVCTFSEIVLKNVTFRDCHFENCTFFKVNVEHCVFYNCIFERCDIDGTFKHDEFKWDLFHGCQMTMAHFVRSHLTDCNVFNPKLEQDTVGDWTCSGKMRFAAMMGCTVEQSSFVRSKIGYSWSRGNHLNQLTMIDCSVGNLIEDSIWLAVRFIGIKSVDQLPPIWYQVALRDLRYVLTSIPDKAVQTVLDRLKVGEINGSSSVGSCGCLMATVCDCLHMEQDDFKSLVPEYEWGLSNPMEQFIYQIRAGDTSEDNYFAGVLETELTTRIENGGGAFWKK